MDTYGFHTIHGRAPAFATGLKAARPDLSVWVITGDGDGLSIGGNHLIHALRRNIDLQIVLFNNQIYGLTKGQYSPTSELGKRTKSSPFGSIDEPFRPLSVALGAEAAFVARTLDREQKHLGEMLVRAAEHRGASFLEVYQNCNIFNDGAYAPLTEKATKADTQLVLEHGAPLLFGAKRDKGIVFDGFAPSVVAVADVGIEAITVHDEQGPIGYHVALARLRYPEFPTAFGVIRCVERPTYDAMMAGQLAADDKRRGPGDLQALLESGDTWLVQ
jgi:2-oxoglutarate ferredoxin oxidoreductase subunit beta